MVRRAESELREPILELTERVADRISGENTRRVADATDSDAPEDRVRA